MTVRISIKENYRAILLWGLVFIFLYFVGTFIPEGFDWKWSFSQGKVPSFWTPWTPLILRFLNFPLLVALTLFPIIYRTYRYNRSPLPMALAIISLPTLWVLILGNLEGLVLIGILLLPWGVPLVLMKPQIAAFTVLAKKSSLIAAVAWLLLSFLIWGFWPMSWLTVFSPGWKVEWVQDITLFPWGLLIALPLLWFSRGDEDLLMAAGSFATPHLFPYHFILLMPALGRMKWIWMLPCWLLSWSPLLANWWGPNAWHLGNLFALCLWCGIYFSRKHPVE